MTAKKVVCLVINSLGGGGAERVFARLANMLGRRDNDYKLVVITLDTDIIENPILDSIEHIQLNCAGSLLKSIINLRKILKSMQPTVVISFLTRANVCSVIAAFRNSFKVIISERVNTSSHFGKGLKGQIKKSFTRFFYEKATVIIAVSEGVKEDLNAFFKLEHKDIIVIGNSYSYTDLLKKASEFDVEYPAHSYIVCVGRFYKNKNHSLLIKAMKNTDSPKTLVLLGDGPLRAELEELVIELGLEDKVVFKGFVNNPYPYIKNSAGLISASLAEGFPNVIAEALVLGKFVVSSDCQSGPSELLNECVSLGVKQLSFAKFGVLLPVNDEVATAQGIALFNQPETINTYQEKTIYLRERYSHQAFLSRFTKIINEALDDNK
ncbi:glycosyltransferase [Pseudoalteromonas mariniglutinosa]|uniref:glycosyltransferase n=1 Tax=Pseudoalteromonas mariniglutinosa TaxID=206042 RepID=UPI00384B4B1B